MHVTEHGLRLHCLRLHPETLPPREVAKAAPGISLRVAKNGLIYARKPLRNQEASWKRVTSVVCPDCARICTSISACRKHWSNVCSHPLAKKCPGCQLLIKATVSASFKPGGRKRPHVPLATREKARTLHTCMADPKKAPSIARQSLGRAGVAKPPRVQKSKATATKPAVERLPRRYQLLPTATVRKFIRPKVRIGKKPMFSHPYCVIRPELYKPLPAGWDWPPIPFKSDLPYPRIKRKKKRRIPQEVLDEWRQFRTRRSSTGPTAPSSSGAGLPGPTGNVPDDLPELLDHNNQQGDSSDGEPPDDEIFRGAAALGFDDGL